MNTHKAAWLTGVALSALTALAPITVMAATEMQIVTSIDNGLAYLNSAQTAGGYWNYGGYEEAATGAAVSAFMSQQSNWGTNAAAYQTVVNNAMSYLLANASTNTVGVRDDGNNPCGAGTCTGVYWAGNGEATYTTGLVASAIGQYAAGNPGAVATTTGALAGMTWTQIAQGITNEYAGSQATANDQIYTGARGGWRYYIPGNGDADSSTTQWAVLSMIYDQSLGAITPAFVKSELQYWLAFAQAPDGSGCYQGPGSGICEQSDTGSVLIGLKFTGTSVTDPAVQKALAWLNAHWTEAANNTWYGDFGNPYTMWADYKALEITLGLTDNSAIINLLSDCGAPNNLPGNPPGSTACNWWQDYNQWLVDNQNTDGSWSGTAYWTGPLATAFDVSILGGTVIPVVPTQTATLFVLGVGMAGLGLVRRYRRMT